VRLLPLHGTTGRLHRRLAPAPVLPAPAERNFSCPAGRTSMAMRACLVSSRPWPGRSTALLIWRCPPPAATGCFGPGGRQAARRP